jgi:hypothetical protein
VTVCFLPRLDEIEPVTESDSLVVTLQQFGSLRPNLSGSKSHADLSGFGLNQKKGIEPFNTRVGVRPLSEMTEAIPQ